VRLIQAMAANRPVSGYLVSQPSSATRQAGNLTLTLLSEYRGPRLVGRAVRVQNRAAAPVRLQESDLAPPGTLALTIEQPELGAGEATIVYFVSPLGGR
jgi:hypothetical protein